MQYDYFFREYRPDTQMLLNYGFVKSGDKLIYRAELMRGFTAEFCIGGGAFGVTVYDCDTGEEYFPFKVAGSEGAFVGEMRFTAAGIRKKVEELIRQKFGSSPEYPWSEYPQFAVYKNAKGKWFALFMRIPAAKLIAGSSGEADVINLKARPESVEKLADGVTVFPAYHMNKKHWITVLLKEDTDLDFLLKLIEESFEAVKK